MDLRLRRRNFILQEVTYLHTYVSTNPPLTHLTTGIGIYIGSTEHKMNRKKKVTEHNGSDINIIRT